MSKKMDSNSKNDSKLNYQPPNYDSHDLLQFFLGIILIGAGLFMLSKRVVVSNSWYTWRIFNFDLSSGTVTIPLIIGIIWYFFDTKSIIPKIIITLSIIFIVLTIIMSVRLNFIATSLFDYILIFGMAAAGSGLLLKVLFKH
jgi:hypothetical protein